MPGNMKLTSGGNQSLLTVIVKAKKGAEKFKGKKKSFLKPLLARVKDQPIFYMFNVDVKIVF